MSLDGNAHDLLNCRAGTIIRIPVMVTGRPVPKVTWTFDGTAETEKKNELHTLPVDSEVRLILLLGTSGDSTGWDRTTYGRRYGSSMSTWCSPCCFSQIHSTDTTSVVLIPESKLNHSGRYIINAESPAGHKVLKVRVNVLGEENKKHLTCLTCLTCSCRCMTLRGRV